MATNHNPTNTNNERTGYAEGYTRALNESFCPQASTFLRSRKQSISIDWEMGADHGGTPARIKGTMTYTRKVFADYIRDVLPTVLEHGTMSGFKGTDPANIGIPALASILATENSRSKYTPFAMEVAKVRRNAQKDAKSAKKKADIKAARKAGDTVFTDNEGGEWLTREKAVKSTARNLFGNDWWKDNKAENYRKADAATPGGESAPAPVAQQSSASASVNAQQAKNMAKALGATGADIKTKASAVAFLEARGISL